MSNQRKRRAKSSSPVYWMAVLALAAGLGACSEGPGEEVREAASSADKAAPEDSYAQLVAGFDSSGRAGVEAARNADRATLLLFSASW